MNNDLSWQTEHKNVIHQFLIELNNKTDEFILKGGTALMMCYGLDRFSEDIDLDSTNKEIESIVKGFCSNNNFTYRVAKDTETVKRYMIHYNDTHPLKIEISYRKKNIDKSDITNINNISVYDINTMCMLKANAYNGRDKIRDLYDLSFICNNYWDILNESAKKLMQEVVSYKGVEQFDFLVKDQSDELINNDKLAEEFLKMYEKLDIYAETTILKQIINSLENNNLDYKINNTMSNNSSINDIDKITKNHDYER